MGESAVKVPRHLWIVGVVSLLWNAVGGYDYTMSKVRGDAWLVQAGMTPEQIAHYHAMPAWMTAVWAIGVWGAIAGSVLLLLRNKAAVPVFAVSLAAFLLSLLYARVLAPMPGAGTGVLVLQAAILAACLFFVWYSRRARSQGLLR